MKGGKYEDDDKDNEQDNDNEDEPGLIWILRCVLYKKKHFYPRKVFMTKEPSIIIIIRVLDERDTSWAAIVKTRINHRLTTSWLASDVLRHNLLLSSIQSYEAHARK